MEEILDYLDHEDHTERTYEYASKGKRFANYLIDLIAQYGLLFGIFVGNELNRVQYSDPYLYEEPASPLMDYLWGAIMVVFYYSICEYFFKGKTLGKLITRTRAVMEDNRRLDFQSALVRSLIRVVPFEAFSYLGEKPTGWHDDWSKTKVILDEDWRG